DLIEDLSERLGSGLEAAAIERIDIDTFFWAATLAAQTVRTSFGLRFSLPNAIARRIVHGRVALTDDGDRAFRDPAVAALAQRIFVVEDKAASSTYPDRQPTRVRITFKDGRSETAGSERMLGEWDYPLPIAALQAKFVELIEGAWGGGGAVRAPSCPASRRRGTSASWLPAGARTCAHTAEHRRSDHDGPSATHRHLTLPVRTCGCKRYGCRGRGKGMRGDRLFQDLPTWDGARPCRPSLR